MVSLDVIVVDPPEGGQVFDPLKWFDSPGPFELEIGSGKGGFLLSRARANPHIRLLGIEMRNKYFRYCAARMVRWQLDNVRVMRIDARLLIMVHLPPACVSVLHLYHPDPWPKKRHHKRRLVQPDFVEAAIRTLAPGGRWLIQSDHAEYFQQIERLLSVREELAPLDWEQADAPPGPDWQGTNFEIKYARAGHSIYRAAYSRR